MPSSTRKVGRACRTISSCTGLATVLESASLGYASGYCSRRRTTMAARSAWACARATPGLTRAKAASMRASRFSMVEGRERNGQAEAGMYTSLSSG